MIKQRLVKKSIDMMADLARSNVTAYDSFWKNFGKYIKVGIIEDEKNRDDLIPLCRFYSSHTGASDETEHVKQEVTSLPDYVERMPDDRPAIYYVVGETRAQAAMSPTLEKLKEENYEIL